MSRQTRDTVTGTNAWQLLTNITLGPSPVVVPRPFHNTNHFYRATCLP